MEFSLIAILCGPDCGMIDASDVPLHPVPQGKITRGASQRSSFFAPPHSISHCCPARHFAAWVELNGVRWCEWDVSSKNIAHQKVFPGRSATSRCAHSPHALASFFSSPALTKVKNVEEIVLIWTWTGLPHIPLISSGSKMFGSGGGSESGVTPKFIIRKKEQILVRTKGIGGTHIKERRC